MSERADQALAIDASRCAVPSSTATRARSTPAASTSGSFRRRGWCPSMSRKGTPYDNAVVESFFSSPKQELTRHERFVDLEQARNNIFDYIDIFYNRQHLHSSLGCRSPAEHDKMAMVPNNLSEESGLAQSRVHMKAPPARPSDSRGRTGFESTRC